MATNTNSPQQTAAGNWLPIEDDLRRWAAQQLELADDASAADAERAFVRLLNTEDLVPPRDARFALEVLRRPAGESLTWASQSETWRQAFEAYRFERERRLRAEVEKLAQQFFGLSPAERRTDWQSLHTAAEDCPAVVRRLAALEPGLDVTLPPVDYLDENTNAFLEDLCQILTAHAADQPARRRAFLDRKAGRQEWIAASRQVRQAAPQFAAWAADELTAFDRWIGVQGKLAKLRNKAENRTPPRVVVSSSGSQGGGSFPVWAVPVAVVLLTTAMRSCDHNNKPASRGHLPYVQSNEDRARELQRTIEKALQDREAWQRPENRALRRLYGIPDEALPIEITPPAGGTPPLDPPSFQTDTPGLPPGLEAELRKKYRKNGPFNWSDPAAQPPLREILEPQPPPFPVPSSRDE